jgi:hypothetical protein
MGWNGWALRQRSDEGTETWERRMTGRRKKKAGLSRNLIPIFCGVDDELRKRESVEECRKHYQGKFRPGSTITHDSGNYGDIFAGCKEDGSDSAEAHDLLNPINRFTLIQRCFKHHPQEEHPELNVVCMYENHLETFDELGFRKNMLRRKDI